MASTNFNNALAWRGKWIDLLTCANTVDAGMFTWSRVLQHFTRSPTGCVSERDSWRDFSSSSSSSTYNESCYLLHRNSIGWMNEDTLCFGGVGLMLSMWEDMGRILSWSSITTQWWQLERDSRNLHRERQREVHTCTTKKLNIRFHLSLNLAVSCWWASVLYRECTSMVSVYSCLSDVIVLSNRTTTPPPSTVSTVRARRLGVRASKSYKSQDKWSKCARQKRERL